MTPTSSTGSRTRAAGPLVAIDEAGGAGVVILGAAAPSLCREHQHTVERLATSLQTPWLLAVEDEGDAP